MRQCPFCGHQNQNKDFFCVHCGELLPPRLSVARIVRNFFGVALVYTSFVMFALCERHGVCVFIGIGCIIGSIALFRRSKRERQEKKLLKSRNSQRKNTPAKVNEAPRESISQAQGRTVRGASPQVRALLSAIPADVYELLYISGKDTPDSTPGSLNEPSFIDLSLPVVSERSAMWDAVDVGYYPSYRDLSPEQRGVYLSWLADISRDVPIGYVFIFYYGLERLLYTPLADKACDMIIKLRKYHRNNSFNNYSADALIMYARAKKDPASIAGMENMPDTLRVWLAVNSQGYLTADDIADTYRVWGFDNPRYITGADGLAELFRLRLTDAIVDRYGEGVLRVDSIRTSRKKDLLLANYSLPENMRHGKLPDVTQDNTLRSKIYALLCTTHEAVKVEAREIRKAARKE